MECDVSVYPMLDGWRVNVQVNCALGEVCFVDC
jgi:hypothetical protein